MEDLEARSLNGANAVPSSEPLFTEGVSASWLLGAVSGITEPACSSKETAIGAAS
jgi:hypothetical protein